MCEHLSPLIGNGSVRRLREAQLLPRILSDVAGWQQRRVAQALEVADATVSQWMRTSGAVQSPSGCRVACSCSAVAAERIAARNADCWFSTAGMWCGRALAEQINMINPAELEGEEILARYDRLLRMAERESRAITALGRVMRITQRSRVRAEPVARRSRMPARAGSLRIGSRQQNRKRSPPRLVWFDVGHMT
jgi:hypothetical protein